MSTEVKLPELGENITSATVVKVLVEAGEDIDEDAPIIEVETDKATAEVPSSSSGTIGEIKVEAGDSIKVGDVILVLDHAAKAREEPESGDERDADATDDEGTEEQPDAKAPDARAETGGDGSRTDTETYKESKGSGPADGGARAAAGASGLPTAAAEDAPVTAAPSARRLAHEIGVDIERVHGSGPGGRVSIRDVKRHAHEKRRDEPGAAPADPTSSHEPLTPIRRQTAAHVSWCWRTIPHVTLFARADVTGLDDVLAEHREAVADAGGKLTITAVVIKAVAAALVAFPRVNASYDEDNEHLVVRPDVNIGMAVDTPDGLVVPVIRDAARQGIAALAVEMTALAERARSGELTRDDLEGGTFTITNLGGMDVDSFTPIVNHPEVAILGVGQAQTEPTFIGDELAAVRRLPLALSFDHRAMDGADGARFLRWISRALAQPLLIAMGTEPRGHGAG